jgi:thiamine-monophosphate kinase
VGEFDLIARFFTRPCHRAVLGVGDDCALLQPTPGMQLAISTDMLVSGQHFFADVDPVSLGHKALAVNLSDLAACGAKPWAFTLALALPESNPAWLGAFAQGLFALADLHDCDLIGGDTTRGPLTINITIFGETPPGQALLRSGAQLGDDIYVSGTLGDARLALEALQGKILLPEDQLAQARLRLEQPTPRITLGLALRGIATAAIDVSDGLLGDLQHVLDSSQLGASLHTQALHNLMLIPGHPLHYILAGGDDYELVFTAPFDRRAAVASAARASGTRVTRIGQTEKATGIRLLDAQGALLSGNFASFDHFKAAG